jgi:hypothetical protein
MNQAADGTRDNCTGHCLESDAAFSVVARRCLDNSDHAPLAAASFMFHDLVPFCFVAVCELVVVLVVPVGFSLGDQY